MNRRAPFYWRALRLRHLRPNGWQRAVFADLPIVVAIVLVLADVASAWTLLILPLVVAAVVKFNDLLTGLLDRPRSRSTAVNAPGSSVTGLHPPDTLGA